MAILKGSKSWYQIQKGVLPLVNILQYPVGLSFTMGADQPLLDPLNNMVLECPLDYLMEEIRSYHFVYICSGKMCGERLKFVN